MRRPNCVTLAYQISLRMQMTLISKQNRDIQITFPCNEKDPQPLKNVSEWMNETRKIASPPSAGVLNKQVLTGSDVGRGRRAENEHVLWNFTQEKYTYLTLF